MLLHMLRKSLWRVNLQTRSYSVMSYTLSGYKRETSAISDGNLWSLYAIRQDKHLLLPCISECFLTLHRRYSPRKYRDEDFLSTDKKCNGNNEEHVVELEQTRVLYKSQQESKNRLSGDIENKEKELEWNQKLFLGEDNEEEIEDIVSKEDERWNEVDKNQVTKKFIKPLAVIDSVLSEDLDTKGSGVVESITKLVSKHKAMGKDILPEDIPIPPVEVVVPKCVLDPTTVEPLVLDKTMLQKLDNIGISMLAMHRAELTQFVLTSNFDESVKPALEFLADVGVPEDKLGRVINMFPFILKESLKNLEIRVDYFKSKRFKQSAIVDMILLDPRFLCTPLKEIDKKLGFYQKTLKLTGNEVRSLGEYTSRLIMGHTDAFQVNRYYMEKIMGFSISDIKAMFLRCPRIFVRSKRYLIKQYDYIHNIMGISNNQIVQSPEILAGHLHEIRNRHRLLVKQGRDQFDPTLPNYVPLKSLSDADGSAWVQEYAKCTVEEYDKFLRMI